MSASNSQRRAQQSPVMLDAREQWWSELAKHGDPLPQTNVFEAFQAGYEAAVKRMKEAT